MRSRSWSGASTEPRAAALPATSPRVRARRGRAARCIRIFECFSRDSRPCSYPTTEQKGRCRPCVPAEARVGGWDRWVWGLNTAVSPVPSRAAVVVIVLGAFLPCRQCPCGCTLLCATLCPASLRTAASRMRVVCEDESVAVCGRSLMCCVVWLLVFLLLSRFSACAHHHRHRAWWCR